ncbi:MAG: hypothetical protein NZ529_02035 [Cytophagaceae bacterium]|nr:hypothetical protein [Cytophagaceae bacterium]MDW8455547.1 hypothetical protein [Cytophagaceae bacterium]
MEAIHYIIHFFILTFLILWFYRKNKSSQIKSFYWPAVVFKLLCGVLYGLLYKYVYLINDTFSFYHSSLELANIALTNLDEYIKVEFSGKAYHEGTMAEVVYNSSDYRYFYFVRLINPLFIFCGMNYWICSAYLSFLSFLACWKLANTLIKLYQLNTYSTVFAFLFFPSFVFSSCGLSKESVTIAALFYFISEALLLMHDPCIKNKVSFFISLLFLLLIAKLKYYYVAMVLICVAILWLYLFLKKFFSRISLQKIFLIISLALPVMIYFASFIHPVLSYERLLIFLHRNYIMMLLFSEKGHYYTYSLFTPDWKGFLLSVPEALFNGLFGPMLWHAYNFFTYTYSMENLIVFLFCSSSLIELFRKHKYRIDDSTMIAYVVCVFYTLILAVFMALSAPNWGTLIRYKVAYMPFFILLITHSNPLFLFCVEKKNDLFDRKSGRI